MSEERTRQKIETAVKFGFMSDSELVESLLTDLIQGRASADSGDTT